MNSISVPSSTPAPPPPAQPPVRPTRFTIWCILGVVNAIYTVWWLFTPAGAGATAAAANLTGEAFLGGMFIATALGLVGIAGYWLMRRWGVYVYSAAAVLMAVAVVAGAAPLVVAIRMVVVAGFGWFFIRNMV
jgi:hypothetical protein